MVALSDTHSVLFCSNNFHIFSEQQIESKRRKKRVVFNNTCVDIYLHMYVYIRASFQYEHFKLIFVFQY